jgi:hypothetical protein
LLATSPRVDRSAFVGSCAYNLAPFDLVENARPSVSLEPLSYVEVLLPDVVELQDHRIGEAAVDAGVGREVFDQEFGALPSPRALTKYGLVHVALLVRGVVLSPVLATTGFAVSVRTSV